MKLDLSILNQHVKDGYLASVEDLSTGLLLYNYTDKCTYEGKWDAITRICRGLVIDRNGVIVARPFSKFFNLNEMEETRIENLPKCSYEVFEKLDGSLGILFYYCGSWNICTRGSFNSDQAYKASTLFHKYDLNCLDASNTYLVEIIYPENRIVVDYGDDEKLVLLAIINTKDGSEEHIGECDVFPRARMFDCNVEGLLKLKETQNWKDGEGWVIRYSNGLRVKVKTDDYLRIHKLRYVSSPLSVWESIVDGSYPQIIKEIPEEFRDEIEEIERRFEKDEKELSRKVDHYSNICRATDETISFKERALKIQDMPEWARGALFCIMRGKPHFIPMMNLLRPKSNSFVDINSFE